MRGIGEIKAVIQRSKSYEEILYTGRNETFLVSAFKLVVKQWVMLKPDLILVSWKFHSQMLPISHGIAAYYTCLRSLLDIDVRPIKHIVVKVI